VPEHGGRTVDVRGRENQGNGSRLDLIHDFRKRAAIRDRQPGWIDFQPVGEPMIAGNEPTDGMSFVIFFLGEEASQSGFELAWGSFSEGARKKRGSSTRL
jgi:hypothetical protein